MNLSTEYFTTTTAQDESSYFFTEIHPTYTPPTSKPGLLSPGSYRMINGNMHKVISGLPLEDVQSYLHAAAEPKP